LAETKLVVNRTANVMDGTELWAKQPSHLCQHHKTKPYRKLNPTIFIQMGDFTEVKRDSVANKSRICFWLTLRNYFKTDYSKQVFTASMTEWIQVITMCQIYAKAPSYCR